MVVNFFFVGHSLAMSSIVDMTTFSPHSHVELTELAKRALTPHLNDPNNAVLSVKKEVLQAFNNPINFNISYQGPNMWVVQQRITRLIHQLNESHLIAPMTWSDRKEFVILNVLDYIVGLVLSKQLQEPLTEHCAVSPWNHVLNIMMGGNTMQSIP